MAEPIIIECTLGTDEIARGGQEIARVLNNAIDVGVRAARDVGQQIGQALSGGIEAGLGRTSREQRERASQDRIQAIYAQSAAKIQEIETRKQAQIDVIRERAVQKELEQK